MKTAAEILAGRRAHEPTRETVQFPRIFNLGGWQTSDRRPLIKPTPANLRTFGKTTFARRAINRIKDPIANLAWEIVPRKGVAMNSVLAKQIEVTTNCFARPNHTDSFRSFVEQILEDMMTNGAGCYEHQLGGAPDRPMFMWPTDSMSIQINPRWKGKDSEPRYWQSLGYGNIGGVQGESFKDSEIVYLRQNPSTETPFGLGELEVAFAAINRKLGVSDYAGKLASNAQPSTVMTFPGMSNEQLLTLRQWWRNDIEGQGQQPMIAPPIGSKAEVLSLRATDDTSLFLNYQETQVQEIATAWNIDAMSLNVHHTVNRACYSDDTETLTDKGWKRLDELSADSIVAAYDPDRECVEFAKPESFLVYDYTGDMIHLASQQNDVLVTPDHRMYARNMMIRDRVKTGGGKYEILPAQQMLGGRRFATVASFGAQAINERIENFVLPGCEVRGGELPSYSDRTIAMDDWLAFLGFFISEGHAKRYAQGTWKVNLCQKDGTKTCAEMDALISRLPCKFRINKSKDGIRRWQVADKALCWWLLDHCGHGAHSKKIPKFVFNLPREQMAIIFDAMMKGDGTRDKRGGARKNGIYYTSSIALRDDAQLLATYLGHRAVASTAMTAGVYRVKLTFDVSESLIAGQKNVKRVPYSGRVYCFAVPPHKLFVTRRNGKIAVHGNTAQIIDAADWRNAVVPKATLVEAYITRDSIHRRLGFSQLQFRFVELKRDDELLEAQIYEIEFESNAVTPNEYRATQNKPPLPGQWGDLCFTDTRIAEMAARGAGEIDDPDLPKETARAPKTADKAVADRATREKPDEPQGKSKPKQK